MFHAKKILLMRTVVYGLCFFVVCLVALGILIPSPILATPVWQGQTGSVYATAEDPQEIEFDTDGYLYAGHSLNDYTKIYRIPPGGGAATQWGSMNPVDPDDVFIHGEYVYCTGTYNVYRTLRSSGVSEQWTDLTENRNMCTLTIDETGVYGNAGDVFIGSARQTNDIEYIPEGTRTPVTFVSTESLYVPRSLLFADGALYCIEGGDSIGICGIWLIDALGGTCKINDGGFLWDTPECMVYDETEDVFYVGDRGLGQIVAVPRSGGTATVVGWGFGSTHGMTFGPGGYLYVSDQENDVIWRFTPEPSTVALFCISALGWLVVFRQRHGA